MVFCGPLFRLRCVHVVLNTQVWNFTNPIAAVDFSFKSFKTLRLGIPVLCSHVWHYLWHYIYKLPKTVKPIAFAKLLEFKTEIEQITSPNEI